MIDSEFKNMKFPVLIEKDEDGYYVAECPIFDGCFTQGKTLQAALENIREVISLCLEEKENQDRARSAHFEDFEFHAVTL